MKTFKQWLFSERAILPEDIQYDAKGRPNFRIYIQNNGQIIGLEILQGERYQFAGDLVSDYFGDTSLLKGYKLYNWHSDLPTNAGYGPLFYDIALEIATKNNGYLASATLINRLKNINGKQNKGYLGGDASDEAESIYKFYYFKRNDVEKVETNLVLMNEPDQARKPYLYELYRKTPTILSKLIQMNSKGSPVLVSGLGINAQPIKTL